MSTKSPLAEAIRHSGFEFSLEDMHKWACLHAIWSTQESEACAQRVEEAGQQGYGTLAAAALIRARWQG